MDHEIITNPQFEQDGHLHPDSAAAAAIKALPSGELADKLVDLEALYEMFMYRSAAKRTLRSRIAWWIGGKGLRATRSEVALLAQTIQPFLLREKSTAVALTFGAEYARIAEDMRGFRSFLKRNFESEMERAEDLNIPLLELAKEIMLRGR